VRWIREASPGALSAVIIGLFLVANVVGVGAGLVDACDDQTLSLVLGAIAAPLFGLTMFVACARVTRTFVAIIAALATTVVTGAGLFVLVIVNWAQMCTA
jgi:hypothetical protein